MTREEMDRANAATAMGLLSRYVGGMDRATRTGFAARRYVELMPEVQRLLGPRYDLAKEALDKLLVLPDDIPPHPYAVAMESAMLAPNAQVSLYPWKDIPERIPLALRHIRMFLNAHRP